jgi:hypothetical protein
LPKLSIDVSADVADELTKIIINAPYPYYGDSKSSGSCLIYGLENDGTISTTYCKDLSNRANMEYLISLGKFCVSSINVRNQDSGPAYWSYKLMYNKQVGGYLKTDELKSALPVCP